MGTSICLKACIFLNMAEVKNFPIFLLNFQQNLTESLGV